MKEEVLRLLNAIGEMPPDLNDHLASILSDSHFPKETRILAKGAVCGGIFFVGKGMIVGRKWQRGKEVTSWIMRQGEFVTSPQSFFEQTHSAEWMIAVEPCDVCGITYQQLEETFKRFPLFNLHGRILTLRYYLMSLNREDFLKNHRGKQKYKMLLETDPDLVSRCPNKYLAGYLNVNVTTLSTLKSKIMEGG